MAMATSSVNSTGSTRVLHNSSSDGDMQLLMDQRKRKRMQSNRESARRSRMRKQKHLDDLMAEVAQLKKENGHLVATINVSFQHFVNIDAENSVLSAQIMELGRRLESLNEIVSYVGIDEILPQFESFGTNPWCLPYLNQPISAAVDIFQC